MTHYSRNELNLSKKYESDPIFTGFLKLAEWELLSRYETTTHENLDTDRLKYVSSDDQKRERVYDRQGYLITSPEDMGTYNFAGPHTPMAHFRLDVIPWLLYGNTPDDNTTLWTRSLSFLRGGYLAISHFLNKEPNVSQTIDEEEELLRNTKPWLF